MIVDSKIGRIILGAVLGLSASICLIALFHALDRVAPETANSYHYTQLITRCISPAFVASYLVLAALLGLLLRHPLGVALGMIIPYPIAAVIEISHDKTNHNLLPFEMMLSWGPALIVAFLAALLGCKLRNLISGRETPPVLGR
jgi:hypothetical protein